MVSGSSKPGDPNQERAATQQEKAVKKSDKRPDLLASGIANRRWCGRGKWKGTKIVPTSKTLKMIRAMKKRQKDFLVEEKRE